MQCGMLSYIDHRVDPVFIGSTQSYDHQAANTKAPRLDEPTADCRPPGMPAFPDLDLKASIAHPLAKSKVLGSPMHGTGRRPLVLMSDLYNQDNERMEVRLYNSVPKTHYRQGVTPCPDNI